MTQSQKHSVIETVVGVAVGFVVSVSAAFVIYPLFGHSFTLGQNVGITIVFTALSLVRGYAVRRAFNWWGVRSSSIGVPHA